MVFDILNTPIALSCPVRFQILADIESFAFLFINALRIVFNLIPVFFGKNVRILHVTGSILENPV